MTAFKKLALFALVAFVAGCKQEPSVVGDWTANLPNGVVTFTFAADKSITVVQTLPQVGPVTLKGTFEQDTPETLMIKFTSADVKPTGNAQADALIKTGLDTIKSKPAKFKLAWKEDKQIDLTPVDAPMGLNSNFSLMRK